MSAAAVTGGERRRQPRRVRRWTGRGVLGLFTLAYALFSLFPIFWVITLSFKTRNDAVAFPPKFLFHPTLDAYRQVFGVFHYRGGSAEFFASHTDFPGYFLNSLILSSVSTAVSLAVGIPAAYALARLKASNRVKANLLFTFLSFRFLPEMSIIVPLFVLFQKLHLANTYLGLIWVYQLIGIPLIVLIVRGFFDEIPADLEHAAEVDGASRFQAFRYIALPLAVPAIASAAVLTFIFCWNNFIFGVILGGPDTAPVTVVAFNYLSSQETALSQMAAATVAAAVPSLVLALLIQRFLVRGLTLGAIRG